MHWTTEFKIFCQHFLCVERELWITWGLISDDFYLITWTISFVQEIVSHPGTHFSRAGWNRIFCGLKRWQSHPVQGTVPVGRSEPIYTGTSREETTSPFLIEKYFWWIEVSWIRSLERKESKTAKRSSPSAKRRAYLGCWVESNTRDRCDFG